LYTFQDNVTYLQIAQSNLGTALPSSAQLFLWKIVTSCPSKLSLGGDLTPRLIHGSLDPRESTLQRCSRLTIISVVFAQLTVVHNKQTVCVAIGYI